MLNELSQLVESLNSLGIQTASRHPCINPMGKNKDLLVVSLGLDGKPTRVEVFPGSEAAALFRVEDGSSGSSFPGFNLPKPLRCLRSVSEEQLKPAIEHLLFLRKKKDCPAHDLSMAARALFELSEPRTFKESQERQFSRSCAKLVNELQGRLAEAPEGLTNFCGLLDVVATHKPKLSSFATSLSELLIADAHEAGREALLLFQDVLFGALGQRKSGAAIGTDDYWNEKDREDKKGGQPIYLDLADPDPRFKRVAHRGTSGLLNRALLAARPSCDPHPDLGGKGVDAFTGQPAELEERFPSPKVAELGNLKLFSVNTNEVHALFRYRLAGSKVFPVAKSLAQKMNDALLHLASDEERGMTCCAIPSAQPGKRDLLVAYLEGELAFSGEMAEMFGGEINAISDADFAAIAQPVLEMLEGKVTTNPNLNIRLLAFCSLDKGRKQISMDRCFRVADVIRAAKDWQAGAGNAPEVSVRFYDKCARQFVFPSRIVPCPLELASAVNRVWGAGPTGGFTPTFQRAVACSDAYDVFMGDSPISRQKAQRALALLVQRMVGVLVKLGAIRITREWSSLSDLARLQGLKAIAFFGILLRQLNPQQQSFMQEPITHVGRLLALADSLHQQYCEHVRKGEVPSQLIGNALLNTALDQPVFALARLAERLTPYQAWAKTFRSEDADTHVGLVKYFLREIAASVAAIRVDDLPNPMSDADKAKLLLGYLADHPKSEASNQ